MIDAFLHCLDQAEREAAIGGAGVGIAASMLRVLRRDFPPAYVMPWLDTMGDDPTAPRWDDLREEVLAAAGALLGQHVQGGAHRKAQARIAATRPRGSKWDAFRAALAADLDEVGASPLDGADVLEAELRALWRGRGLTGTPPRSTVIKWVRAR